jgi:hypothetical protein
VCSSDLEKGLVGIEELIDLLFSALFCFVWLSFALGLILLVREGGCCDSWDGHTAVVQQHGRKAGLDALGVV